MRVLCHAARHRSSAAWQVIDCLGDALAHGMRYRMGQQRFEVVRGGTDLERLAKRPGLDARPPREGRVAVMMGFRSPVRWRHQPGPPVSTHRTEGQNARQRVGTCGGSVLAVQRRRHASFPRPTRHCANLRHVDRFWAVLCHPHVETGFARATVPRPFILLSLSLSLSAPSRRPFFPGPDRKFRVAEERPDTGLGSQVSARSDKYHRDGPPSVTVWLEWPLP